MKESFTKNIEWFVSNIESRKGMLPTFASASSQLATKLRTEYNKFIDDHAEDKTFYDNEELAEFSIPTEHATDYKNLRRELEQADIFTDLLPKMTLVSLVSLFDAYIARVIRTLLIIKPEILNGSEKQLSFSDISELGSIEAARDHIMDLEIESLLRDSRDEQFTWLEKKLKIKLRSSLDIWGDFIEITERRNLLVHADGIVSKQYLIGCKQNNIELDNGIQVGDSLNVPPDYYERACDIFAEIGVKLAQVIWRKIAPEDINVADSSLIDVTYDFLFHSEYKLAEVIAKFAEIPAVKISCSENVYYLKINLAISLKGQRREDECLSVLDSIEWGALADKFKIANSVLREDWEEAAFLMKRMRGMKILDKEQYRVWPLFRWFRKEDVFKNTYFEVFGEEFKIQSTDDSGSDREEPDDL